MQHRRKVVYRTKSKSSGSRVRIGGGSWERKGIWECHKGTQGITDAGRQGQGVLPPSGFPGLSRISVVESYCLPALPGVSSLGS